MNEALDPDRVPDGFIDQVIAARYRIEAQIGIGAMGTVYRARHIKLGRAFAIKVLRPSLLDDPTIRRRFTREAELAGALHHANIVSMVDLGETPEGLHYLVMEHAPGETLYDVMVRSAPMPSERVIAIVRQLCDGLEHAHDRGLIHRDFKPENVIVERGNDRDQLKIVDFGIAILRDEAVSSSPERLTTAGIVLGTPHYMAPEQALGQPIDHRVDLFALGVMCFEMLTGRPPFDGDGVDVALANVGTETPAMHDRAPGRGVDPLLEGFTRRLMTKSRDDRPATAAAARGLLDLIERDRTAAAVTLGDAMPLAALSSAATAPLSAPLTIRTPAPPPGPAPLRAPAVTPPEAQHTLRTPVAPPPAAAKPNRAPVRPAAAAWNPPADYAALQAAVTAPIAPLAALGPRIDHRPVFAAVPVAPSSFDHRAVPTHLQAEITEQIAYTPPSRIRLAILALVVAVAAATMVMVALAVALRLRH